MAFGDTSPGEPGEGAGPNTESMASVGPLMPYARKPLTRSAIRARLLRSLGLGGFGVVLLVWVVAIPLGPLPASHAPWFVPPIRLAVVEQDGGGVRYELADTSPAAMLPQRPSGRRIGFVSIDLILIAGRPTHFGRTHAPMQFHIIVQPTSGGEMESATRVEAWQALGARLNEVELLRTPSEGAGRFANTTIFGAGNLPGAVRASLMEAMNADPAGFAERGRSQKHTATRPAWRTIRWLAIAGTLIVVIVLASIRAVAQVVRLVRLDWGDPARCPRCRYSLDPATPRCPECGTPIRWPETA